VNICYQVATEISISQHSFLATMVSFYDVLSNLGDHVLVSYSRNKQIPTQAFYCNSQLHVLVSATLSLIIPVLPSEYHVMQCCSACLPDVLSLSASAIFTLVCLSRHPSDSVRALTELGQRALGGREADLSSASQTTIAESKPLKYVYV
jgi:hypothetical protein